MAENVPVFKEGDMVEVDHMMESEHDEYDGQVGEVIEVTQLDDEFAYSVRFNDGTELRYFDVELHRA